ncbi:unnamed protein product, partial [Didymodactylos carnosus]
KVACSYVCLWDEMNCSPPTANPAESMNATVEKWLQWKEVSIDRFITLSYSFMRFYVNEIRRGYCGSGSYRLKTGYRQFSSDSGLLTTTKCYDIDQILVKIKESVEKQKQTTSSTNFTSSFSNIDSNDNSIIEEEETNENLNSTTTTLSSTIFNQANDNVKRCSMTVEQKAQMIEDLALLSFDPKTDRAAAKQYQTELVNK